jgi:hypothetical protein
MGERGTAERVKDGADWCSVGPLRTLRVWAGRHLAALERDSATRDRTCQAEPRRESVNLHGNASGRFQVGGDRQGLGANAKNRIHTKQFFAVVLGFSAAIAAILGVYPIVMMLVAGVMVANIADLERWLTGSLWAKVVRDNVCIVVAVTCLFYLFRDSSVVVALIATSISMTMETIRDRMALLKPVNVAVIGAIVGYLAVSQAFGWMECAVSVSLGCAVFLTEDGE